MQEWAAGETLVFDDHARVLIFSRDCAQCGLGLGDDLFWEACFGFVGNLTATKT
jgi:hypothetical protein